MQTFSDTRTTLDLPTEARSWCYTQKWTDRWIAKVVCSRGLHGRLRGVNRGAVALMSKASGLRYEVLTPPSPPALWALRSVARLPEGLIRCTHTVQSPGLSLCLPLINAHMLMNDSARADMSSARLRSTLVSGGECFPVRSCQMAW